MKTLVSQFTMKPIEFMFTDVVSGEGVFLFVDKYGIEWMANQNYFPIIGYRVRLYKDAE